MSPKEIKVLTFESLGIFFELQNHKLSDSEYAKYVLSTLCGDGITVDNFDQDLADLNGIKELALVEYCKKKYNVSLFIYHNEDVTGSLQQAEAEAEARM